jgi:hypothetical protein
MTSSEEPIWLKKLSFAEESSITTTIINVEYRLEKISDDTMKLIKKIGEGETEKYVGLNTGRAIIGFQPVFYDLPTMIKLNQDLIVGPMRELKILVDIPIKIRLQALTGGDAIILDELKDESLLQSHYGPTYGGIFCNAIYSPVHIAADSITERDFCATMPLTVESNHSHPVTVTRVLVAMDKLMLFLMGDNLVSNRVVMKIKNASEADILYRSETLQPDLTRVLENRSPLGKGTMGRLFGLGTPLDGDLEFGF